MIAFAMSGWGVEVGNNLMLILISGLLSGLIGVLVTLWVQKNAAKNAEKMSIFTTLMATRFMAGPTYEKTRVLNLIDVVFYGEKDVIDAWKNLFASYSANEPNTSDIFDKTILLLEKMANHLGYKNINWNVIKNSYCPIGIAKDMQNEAAYKQFQISCMDAMTKVMEAGGGFSGSINKAGTATPSATSDSPEKPSPMPVQARNGIEHGNA